MYKAHIYQHISRQLYKELEELRSRVLAMGGLVEQQIADALMALRNLDFALAERVIKEDNTVNTLELSIDDASMQILIRQHLQENDARVLTTISKIINELERIGDEAQRIAKMVIYLVETPKTYICSRISIQNLGFDVLKMVHDALDAFARLDAKASLLIAKQDIKVDQTYHSLLQKLQTLMMEDADMVPAAIHILWAIRALERIGDHAANVCEHIIYLTYGKQVRHLSLEKIELLLLKS